MGSHFPLESTRLNRVLICIHDSFDPFQLFFSKGDGLISGLALKGLHVVELRFEVAYLLADVLGEFLMV